MKTPITVHAVIETDAFTPAPFVLLFAERADGERAAARLLAVRVKANPDIAADDGAEILRLLRVEEFTNAIELYNEVDDTDTVIELRDLPVTQPSATDEVMAGLLGDGDGR